MTAHPPIILASASVQRKKLMRLTGLPFSVRRSGVAEKQASRGNCAALVKHNARLKAGDVASRLTSGLVIGADTVVYAGGTIIGKPRNLTDARRILRLMARHPQWVYTGVAVVDAATARQCVDYERTRIFMDQLSPREMMTYHRRLSPLDKAGGFDIEGIGGLFIPRIEGCFTNVVGLPLSKLRKMLKGFGVRVL